MLAVSFQFTAGRYHATPWGRHVNEGVPEWPPSPWRVLRALVATWKRTRPELPEDAVAPLLAKLASLPSFVLPRATFGHSRHYVPWDKKGPGDRTLTFDTFVVLERDQPVIALWPDVTLSPDEHQVLASLLDNLPYLGRSESWCKATIGANGSAPNCTPLAGVVPEDAEPVRLLVPEQGAPAAVLCALLVETGDLRVREKRRDPDGSRWVVYARPRDCFEPAPGTRGGLGLDGGPPTIARYALDAKPLPPLTDAVTWAELARRSCMAQYGRRNGGQRSPNLAGRDADGTPLKGRGHAFYLPTDEDGDGRLDHLTIWAAMGFDPAERIALAELSELNPGENRPPVRLVLLGFGAKEDFASGAILFGPKRVWQSMTPFVLNRHPKFTRAGQPKCDANGRQLDDPEEQVRREWERLRALDTKLPSLLGVEPVPVCDLPKHQLRWLDFRRWRSRGPDPALGLGFGFRLTFEAPASGPIALGYGCHFGLGLFVPAEFPMPLRRTTDNEEGVEDDLPPLFSPEE